MSTYQLTKILMGYVTMEAFSAGKGVITSCDSGGVLELVHDGETGLVSNPDAHSLAESLDQLGEDLPTARKVGRNAKALLDQKDFLGITRLRLCWIIEAEGSYKGGGQSVKSGALGSNSVRYRHSKCHSRATT